MQKWEYLTIGFSSDLDIDGFGYEGWELTGVVDRNIPVLIFKRPKQ